MHLLKKPLSFAAVCSVLLQIFTVGAEKITSLPGQPKVSFEQNSGYIHINQPQENERALFYYFAEAETDPDSKPLVLWLTGGNQTFPLHLKLIESTVGQLIIRTVGTFSEPACSSLMQLLCDHGPFKPTGNELLKNEYSWNKGNQSHMILSFVRVRFPNQT